MQGKKIFYRLLRRVGILQHMNINIRTQVNNQKVLIPSINEIGFNNYLNLSEAWMSYVFNSLHLNSLFEGTFVDVGVNLGQTLIKVKTIAHEINYIGFEPNPCCLYYLNQLININKYTHTNIYPVAIGNDTSIAKLRLYNKSNTDSSASLIDNFRSETSIRNTLNIPVYKFSDIDFKYTFKIGILKIDVEGAELEVLESFTEKIITDSPIIFIEILPAYNKKNLKRIDRQEKIQKYVEEFNYSIIRILKQNNEFYGIQDITEFGIHSDLNLCDYILVPKNKSEKLKSALTKKN